MAASGWTLDQLVAQVADRLGDDHPPQVSRRVRQVPDRRAIRWYTTIGLLDRPVLRGRTGLYGRRHLLQLVAIKRLQAAGRSLAEIQAELTGATDETLRRVAGIGEAELAAVPRPAVDGASQRRRFWTATTAATGSVTSTATGSVTSTATGSAAGPAAADAARAAEPAGSAVRYAIELADGVTLLLDAPPGDIAAVRAAARPLLDQLALRAVPEGDPR